MLELSPCPFCGNRLISVDDISTGRSAFFAASCDACEAEGPIARSRLKAINAWNTRTAPAKGDGGE